MTRVTKGKRENFFVELEKKKKKKENRTSEEDKKRFYIALYNNSSVFRVLLPSLNIFKSYCTFDFTEVIYTDCAYG